MYKSLLPLLALLLLWTPGLRAADPSYQDLERRIEELERLVGDPTAEPRVLEEPEEVEEGINLGGAVRVNYSYLDWDEGDDERYGDFDFDTFRINLDGEIKGILLSAEYRFYPQYDFHTPHHAWFGYDFTDNLQGQLGIHQVPFGLQPYASHNFWFSGAYYVGLEDDYDLGLKFLYSRGPWALALAFYKNEELGDPGNAGRYSVDVIDNADGGFAGAQPDGNRETNQFNARVTHTLDHGELGSTELGLSGQWGQLYNEITEDKGDHWAGALHLNGNYGRWNLQLEYAAYGYDQKNPDTISRTIGERVDAEGNVVPIPETVVVDDDIITMGGYSFSWGVPADAQIGIVNLAYALPVDWGPVDSLTFYSDNTVIEPDESRFDTIWQNVVGCLVAAGPLFTYIDLISGEDMIFMGGDMVGDTDASRSRNTRLNINFGYYF